MPVSRSDGLDRDSVGEGGWTLGEGGWALGEGGEEECGEPGGGGGGVRCSRPKEDMSSTKEGSVVIVKIKNEDSGYNLEGRP